MKPVAYFLFLFFLASLTVSARGFRPVRPDTSDIPPMSGPDLAVQWATLSLDVIRSSPANTSTYSSRSLAYLGITMYECMVHSSPKHRSLAGQLSGLTELPKPQANQVYNWPLVLNAAQASMLYKLYPHAYQATRMRIDSLQLAISGRLSATEKLEVIERSVTYGWALAEALFEWSRTDGGYEGFSRNFNLNDKVPVGKGYWVAPLRGQSASRFPLHPTWGNNRPFVPADGQLPLPALPEYSSQPGSPYYKEHEAVYKKNAVLTDEEKAIAIWWADDPSYTAAPPGHSYNLATTAIRMARPDLIKAAETYARGAWPWPMRLSIAGSVSTPTTANDPRPSLATR